MGVGSVLEADAAHAGRAPSSHMMRTDDDDAGAACGGGVEALEEGIVLKILPKYCCNIPWICPAFFAKFECKANGHGSLGLAFLVGELPSVGLTAV